MKRLNGRQRSAESGFTLIELIIVIAILGILAAVAVPWYNTHNCRARDSEGRHILKQIHGGYMIFNNARGTFDQATFSALQVNFMSGRRFTYCIEGEVQAADVNNNASNSGTLANCNGAVNAAFDNTNDFRAVAVGNMDNDTSLQNLEITLTSGRADIPNPGGTDDCN